MDSNEHKAKLVDKLIERYCPQENKWEEIVIDKAPKLFAFGWCQISQNQMAIYGGSDGLLKNSDLWIINFDKKQAEQKYVEGEVDETAFSKLAYREKDKTLYLFAGLGSDGKNYCIPMNEEKLAWKEINKSHLSLNSIGEVDEDLAYREALYFP